MSSAGDLSTGPLHIDVTELVSKIGLALPSSRWLRVEQPRIDGFADATDDHQWIHVDPKRAQRGPYGTTVAHGFLTMSLIAPLLKDMLKVEGASAAFNYGLDRVRFPAPVHCGARIRSSGQILGAEPTRGGVRLRIQLTIEIENQPKPACACELIIFYGIADAE